MNKCCANDLAIICDFDGTISVEDVNTSIFRDFGNDETKIIENKYRNSEIGLRESLMKQYEIIGIDEDTFKNYVLKRMEIDITFFDLYNFAKANNMKLAIVSGGFINYMEILFDKYGRKLDVSIYTNKLIVKDGVLAVEYGKTPECNKFFGPCGICKYQHILRYKQDYKVIYVGDGFTDRCAAENADIVFAKDNLAKYCSENSIQFVSYNNFKEIKDYIVNNVLDLESLANI